MKNVLVVMPFQDSHKRYIASIGRDCSFTYTTIADATPEQVAAADVIFGNADPALVAQSRKLRWLQLNSAGTDPYCDPGIIKPGTILTNATGAYGLTVSEGMVAMPENGPVSAQPGEPPVEHRGQRDLRLEFHHPGDRPGRHRQ